MSHSGTCSSRISSACGVACADGDNVMVAEGSKYWTWATLLETAGHCKRTTSVSETRKTGIDVLEKTLERDRRQFTGRLDDDQITATRVMINCELDWHSKGRPYFKVYPGVLESLRNTSLNFNGDAMKFPFDEFVVMLPSVPGCQSAACFVHIDSGDKIKEMAKQNSDEELACSFAKDLESRGEIAFALSGCISYIDAMNGSEPQRYRDHIVLPVHKGEKLESLVTSVQPAGANRASRLERTIMMFRVIIGVAMFATNQHGLVSPDIDIEALRKKHPPGRSKASKAIAEDRVQKIVSKCKGFRVGGEIDLPRLGSLGGDITGTGSRLNNAHIRSGHMRMQPCGKENKDRKLIFIAPMIIRPDLEMRESRGYQITDDVLSDSLDNPPSTP